MSLYHWLIILVLLAFGVVLRNEIDFLKVCFIIFKVENKRIPSINIKEMEKLIDMVASVFRNLSHSVAYTLAFMLAIITLYLLASKNKRKNVTTDLVRLIKAWKGTD